MRNSLVVQCSDEMKQKPEVTIFSHFQKIAPSSLSTQYLRTKAQCKGWIPIRSTESAKMSFFWAKFEHFDKILI